MKFLRSIVSVAFAFLVLFSSSNLVVGMHFCGGDIQSIAVFGKAEGCPMELNLPPCHKALMKSCCQDELVAYSAQDFSTDAAQITVPVAQSLDIIQTPVPVAEIIPSTGVSGKLYHQYDPPLRSYDRTISLQVFLI